MGGRLIIGKISEKERAGMELNRREFLKESGADWGDGGYWVRGS
jgi:hypothetical protein